VNYLADMTDSFRYVDSMSPFVNGYA